MDIFYGRFPKFLYEIFTEVVSGQFKDKCNEINEHLTDAEMKEIFEETDKDKKGTVTLSEYSAILAKAHRL